MVLIMIILVVVDKLLIKISSVSVLVLCVMGSVRMKVFGLMFGFGKYISLLSVKGNMKILISRR